MFGGRARREAAEAERRRLETVARLRAAGILQDAPPRPRFALVRAAGTVRRATYRARRILAPLAVLALLAVAALVVHGEQTPVLAVTLVVLAAGGLWWRLRSQRLRRRQERRYALACLAGIGGWLMWASAAGPWWTALILGWAVLSTPWWAHHWPRARVEVPDVEPVGDPIVRRWEANVAPNVPALAGATLHDPTVMEHGQEYRVQGIPGRDTINTALRSLAGVASGLVVPATRIVLEPHPDYRDSDPNQGRLRVLHTSPVRDTVVYDRPRVRDGKVELGPYADGVDDALWRIYSANSMWGGFVLGGTGTGKSRILETIALGARHMTTLGQPTMVIYVDGQGGASSTLLWRNSSLRFGPDSLDVVLAAVEREMNERQKWNVIWGLDGFTPGLVPAGAPHGLVGVLVIVDECHKVFRSAASRWADIAREGRKLGVGLIGASQVNDLSAFGNNDALRSSLLAGNGLAFRTPTADAQRLIPGLLIDPATLPAIPGYGYKIAAPQSGERTAPFRARYLPKRDDPTLPVGAVSAEEWFESTPDAELDPMSARAIGDIYTRRHELAKQARAVMLAEIQGREPVRDLVSVRKVAAAAITETAAVSATVTTADAIAALLAERGAMKRADIAAETKTRIGTGQSAVKAALQQLLAAGRVRRLDEHGVYELVVA